MIATDDISISILRKRWDERACLYPFFHALSIDPQGLVLGASTVLVPMLRKEAGASTLNLEGREHRLLATLSILYHKALPVDLLTRVSRAAMRSEAGEQALAHLELAYIGLPKIETMDDAWLLFCADSLLADGAEPHVLMQALGLDTRQLDLVKYKDDQPRVPAGNGVESGRWTVGGARGTTSPRSAEVMLDANPDPIRPGQQYAQSQPRGGPYPRSLPIVGGRGGGGGSGFRSNEGIAKTIELPEKRFGEAAEHYRDAIKSGKPDVLTINREGAEANRAAAIGAMERIPGMHLDEYPPAMFLEGGAGASVRAINPKDNMSIGAFIGNCCRRLPNGTRIKIKIGE